MLLTLVISTALGFLTGLGIGGGSLLVLWLTGVAGLDMVTARGINLLFFLPGAAISLILRRRSLSIRRLLPALAAGCLTAALGSFLAPGLDTGLLRRLFGGLLVLTGLRELCYRP